MIITKLISPWGFEGIFEVIGPSYNTQNWTIDGWYEKES